MLSVRARCTVSSVSSSHRNLRSVSALIAAGLALIAAPAHADARWDALLAGDVVKEPHQIDHGSRRFVGGVSYALAIAGASDVAALVEDVKGFTSFLPLTRKARLVGENDGDRFVEFLSGNSMVSVKYTLRFRRTDSSTLRFWMDPSRPHDIPDAWGYLRWKPVATSAGPRVLMTCAILAELPDDLTRQLFGDRVQNALLSVLPRALGALDDHRIARGARER